MRVIVTGATGNVGTSVLDSLAAEPSVDEIIAIARRLPDLRVAKTRFVAHDILSADLVALFRGADAVVHLAWLLQPSRDPAKLEAVNVGGSRRVFDAAVEAGVSHLVVASSVGAYAPGPKNRRVDEAWPTTGIPSSLYSRQKCAVERILDDLEAAAPHLKVTRFRPALIFKRGAASEIRRLFIGHLLPISVLRSPVLRYVPDVPDLRFQALHSFDVGDAFCRAVVRKAAGAFNLAAEPVLDSQRIADVVDAKRVHVSPRLLRGAAAATYRLRLQPTEPGWVDLALKVPLLDAERATQELGWHPRRTSTQALQELLQGMVDKAGIPTAPLASEGSR